MPDPIKDSPTGKKIKKPLSAKDKDKIINIAFFVILIIGLIIITILLLRKPKSVIYSKQYGDNIETLVEIYSNNDIDLSVAIGEDRTLLKGTYTKLSKEDDKYNGEYEAIFKEDNGEVKMNLVIKDDTLTITYDDGSTAEFKERK